jgi:hypothetical protein
MGSQNYSSHTRLNDYGQLGHIAIFGINFSAWHGLAWAVVAWQGLAWALEAWQGLAWAVVAWIFGIWKSRNSVRKITH